MLVTLDEFVVTLEFSSYDAVVAGRENEHLMQSVAELGECVVNDSQLLTPQI